VNEKYQCSYNGVNMSHCSAHPVWSTEMQFGVMYLETGQANNPNLHSGHLNFTLFVLA